MITWMQRHKKWLIITIWISTIAFVGAGFVGWGQYTYGDKAGAVAKVGNVEITMGELQKGYSRLYGKYNQMFQGNFDEEKATQFGLRKQALEELVQQALLLNLANSYDLEVSDAELITMLKTQEYFFKDGVFNKETYRSVLSQNRLSTKEYEAEVKKDLLIQKTLKLLPVEATDAEAEIVTTLLSIADKISYKVLTQNSVEVIISDELLKPFWETQSQNYMSEVSYDLKFIKQAAVVNSYDDAKVSKHYSENKRHFKDSDGKILPLESAKEMVVAELNEKATKDKALRTYIEYKKGRLGNDVKFETVTISDSTNPFTTQALEKISTLTRTAPYMKPTLVNGTYYTFELIKINPSTIKTYEEAKAEVLPVYMTQTKKTKLLELANASMDTFNGDITDFITIQDANKLTALDATDASEFLQKLFVTDAKRSFIELNSGKIVLFNILEQKLLNNSNGDEGKSIAKIKSGMFSEGLIKNLEKKYQTEIFIQGL